MGLTIVLAIFGLVIALIFSYYPEICIIGLGRNPARYSDRYLDLPQRR